MSGKVCVNAKGELAVTKFAVEPVSIRNPLKCCDLLTAGSRYGICPELPRDLALVCY